MPPHLCKEAFFSDMLDALRRRYLILMEIFCGYMSTIELRAFLDENEGAGGRKPLSLQLYLGLCAKGGN